MRGYGDERGNERPGLRGHVYRPRLVRGRELIELILAACPPRDAACPHAQEHGVPAVG